MKNWTLLFALLLGVTFVALAGGDGKDGKVVRERPGHACYWSEPNTFDSVLTVSDEQTDGGKETLMKYICHNANYEVIRSRNFISDAQPDTWKADGRDKNYSLTRW